jgi:hypothetical protein
LIFFVPNGRYMAMSEVQGRRSTVYINEGDICLVVEYHPLEGDGYDHIGDRQRSLIVHPVHGLCKTFVSIGRGTILDDKK